MSTRNTDSSQVISLVGGNRSQIAAWVSVLFLVTAVGCFNQPAETLPSETDSTPSPVSVEVATAELATLKPTLDLVGLVAAIPEKTAVISPQLGGWVSKLDVVEGQSVHADETLVELDSRSATVAVARAQAIVDEKTAAVKRLKSGYLPEEIAGAKQDAGNAAAMLDGLKNELTALKELLDRNEISSVIYETKSQAVASAQAAYASAEERVKLLEAGTRPEMIAEANGLLDAAVADLAQAKLTLDWCTINSPIEGVIVQLLARQGQYFDRAVSLATVVDLSEVFIQIRIPSSKFANVQTGAAITFELPSLPDQTFSGIVSRISGQADVTTGNVVVFATVDNADHQLRPGLTCQVHVALPEITNAIVIPVSAVADNAGTPVVTLIRAGKAFESEVVLGVETETQVQILQGVAVGDVVATAGGYGLPEAYPVQVASVRK